MAYEGNKTVVPAFRNYTVEQKGLRNSDSIEMLDIITKNVIPVYTSVFAINEPIMTQVGTDVWDGQNSTASTTASVEATIKLQIEYIMEIYQ